MTNPVTITAPAGLPFIDIEREFDAPVAAVFGAHRDPALYAQWIGPRGYRTELEHFDFTTGGGYRFISTTPDGQTAAFHGVFHVVRENEFAIQTFEYEGVPDVVSIESLTLTPLPGDRTRLSIHSVYPSVEARDGMIAGGMERGVTEGYERLDELVAGKES
ncbi:SRPBCC family protein [Lysinimonas soli]|uniref:SRPBCC family protein n=1 Tax=Lysinimonas soli TaxID=1074233 RepID=A0ABW0NTQ7_9MICO